MRYSLHPPPRRGGFTLVEMMVATALIIFIMYILATAFEKGLESFRMMKIAGDMQEQLRTASVAMKSDLGKPHFNDKGSAFGEYLSDDALDPTSVTWSPPTKGYFRIDFGRGSLDAAADEGMDPDDPSLIRTRRLPSKVNTATELYPSLQFTVRLSGERRDQFFTAPHNGIGGSNNLNNWSQPNYTVGEDPTMFSSNWGEVTYFVQPTTTTPGGTQLYALYRRVKLLYDPATGNLPPLPSIPISPTTDNRFANYSFWRRPSTGGNRAELNTPQTVTAPQRRFGTPQNQSMGLQVYGAGDNSLTPSKDVFPGSDVAGTDLLLANVTDFEIKAQWDIPKPADIAPNGPFNAFYAGLGTQTTAVDYPFDVPQPMNPLFQRGYRIFDTWSTEEDTSGAYPEYSYGRPRVDDGKGGLVLQTGSDKGHGKHDPKNKNLANWNAGHFTTHVNPNNMQAESIPIRVKIKAVQIKIRIWDQKSQQSRQITLVQDL